RRAVSRSPRDTRQPHSFPTRRSSDLTDGAPSDDTVAAVDRSERPARVFSSSRAPTRPGEAEKISFDDLVIGLQADVVFRPWMMGDRKSTRLNSSHVKISYAVFCLKKK